MKNWLQVVVTIDLEDQELSWSDRQNLKYAVERMAAAIGGTVYDYDTSTVSSETAPELPGL